MKAYSQDFRERVVGAWDEGRGTRPQIAGWFGVSTAWIRRLLQRRRDTGSLAVQPHAGGSAPKLDLDHELRLTALVTAQPDATLVELRQRLGLSVHRSTVAPALLRRGWRVKKKSCGRPSRTVPTSARNG